MAPVYMAFLRFMGDENEARNYSYSLEVGANGRKLIWEGTPRSIRDSHRKVRDSHDGLIIQRNMALFFSGGDRKELKLRVTGRIWKEQQNPDAGVCIPNLCSWHGYDFWSQFFYSSCVKKHCCVLYTTVLISFSSPLDCSKKNINYWGLEVFKGIISRLSFFICLVITQRTQLTHFKTVSWYAIISWLLKTVILTHLLP